MSLEGEVNGRDMRPEGKTTSTANRAAASKVSTAWACLPATPANMRAACITQRPDRRGNRHCAATGFVRNEEPAGARKVALLVVVDRQSVQHRRIGIEYQHAHVGERGQVQHLTRDSGMPFCGAPASAA